MTTLKPWAKVIDSEDWDSLILGNGASIAVFKSFDYKSLYRFALKQGLLNPGVKSIFNYLKTTDFELALEMLWGAHVTNRLLGVKNDKAGGSYIALRTALIEAVKEVHPEHADVAESFDQIASFMKQFQTVHCLNYDLTVYWAMMHWNHKDVANKDRFMDGLLNQGFPKAPNDWPSRKGGRRVTRVLYPHGSLILASDLFGNYRKISAGRDKLLLVNIGDAWEQKELIPMFVSEEKSPQKRKNIERSHYLRTVFNDYLPLCKNVVIFGWSLEEKDQHLITKMLMGRVARIAISVYPNGKSASAIEAECEAMAGMIVNSLPANKEAPIIDFFDSTSPGCWVS
jgi:hypothetical protein